MAKRRPSGAGMDPVKRKDGRYAARVYVYQPDGTRKPKWVYSRDYEECLRKRDELLAKVRDRIPVPSRSSTLAEWLDYWLESIVLEKHPYTTYARYESSVRLYLKPLLGTRRLDGLSVTLVRTFRDGLKRKKGASIAANALAALRSALTGAMKEEILTRNVAQLVDFPELEDVDYPQWTTEEAIAFFRGAREHRMFAGFLLALVVGLRRGEVRGLRWSDLDFERRTIRVWRQWQSVKVPGKEERHLESRPKGKGRKKFNQGYVGMPEILIQPLIEHRERLELRKKRCGSRWIESDLVFTGPRGQPMYVASLKDVFQRLTKRLGLPVTRLHDARHKASTLLADTGAQPHVVQSIMGHSQVDTTMTIYTHAELEAQREAMDRVGRLLIGGTDVSN